MTIEEMRNRLAAIVNLLTEFDGAENFSAEDTKKINDLNEEFTNLKTNIETKEKIEAMNAIASKPGRKVNPEIEVRAPKAMGFNNMGDFCMSVKKASLGDIDNRFNNTAYEKYGEDGGFLIPEEFMSGINKKMEADDSLLAKTRQLKLNGNSITLKLDETAPWSGGVTAYWIAEGASYTDSKPKFTEASWRLAKVGALVPATEELLDDAAALESYIKMSAPEAIQAKVNEAIISGDGVGKPTGFLNSGFKVKVSKESAQAADTVVAANIVKMYSRMLPKSRMNAIWLINPQVEEQLRLAKDGAGNYIYLAPGSQLNQTPYAMLMGRPVLPMLGGVKALGDEGDISFVDLNYYYSIIKAGGVKNAVSTHLYFDKDITAFKFTLRLNGHCPYSSPVTTQYGAYDMSGLVTLEAR